MWTEFFSRPYLIQKLIYQSAMVIEYNLKISIYRLIKKHILNYGYSLSHKYRKKYTLLSAERIRIRKLRSPALSEIEVSNLSSNANKTTGIIAGNQIRNLRIITNTQKINCNCLTANPNMS